MLRFNQEKGRYRVLLISIGDNTEEEKHSFCHNISKNYSIPFLVLKKIIDRCPIILKKNLSLKKAETLAKTLKSFGAIVSVEEKSNFPPLSLEFQELVPHQLALESSHLRKTQRGTWSVIGRVKNISDEALNDTWVLIQLFDMDEELMTFEEVPLSINPLPPGEASPYKVVSEGDFSIKRISIAFKNASGQPIPAIDKRKKREWVEVEIKDEEGRSLSSAWMPAEAEERSQAIDLTEPIEEVIIEKEMDTARKAPPSLEQEASPSLEEEIREEQGGDVERVFEESLSLPQELSEEVQESTSDLVEENSYRGEESERALGNETFQSFTPPVSEELEEGKTEERALEDLKLPSDHGEAVEASHLDASVFKETAQLIEDISESAEEFEEKTEKKGEEAAGAERLPSFPWIESFKDAIETYYQKPCDIFWLWFEECRKQGEFKNFLHPLLTILVHSRFDQENQSVKALENTKRVFRLIVQPNLLFEEVPSLEGTSFVSGEVWRELFHRAIPKVQQIGNAILKKNKWSAFELERLIQVIPHMGHRNSRMAIRWITELIPDVVEVDFADTPITIGESLYRVASRLGVVDPHVDYYQGRYSVGDMKIQSFAKMAFPQNPGKIEEPMAWVGMEEERGGYCFPIQPRCEKCLFENFCPRLYLQLDPSDNGMRE